MHAKAHRNREREKEGGREREEKMVSKSIYFYEDLPFVNKVK